MAVMTQQEMGWCQRLFLIRIIGNKGEGSAIDASFNFMESCLQLSSRQAVSTHYFFLRADFTDLTSLSHHPPHQGELGAMNRYSGVKGPN